VAAYGTEGPVTNGGWQGWWVISPADEPTEGRNPWNTVGGYVEGFLNKVTPADIVKLITALAGRGAGEMSEKPGQNSVCGQPKRVPQRTIFETWPTILNKRILFQRGVNVFRPPCRSLHMPIPLIAALAGVALARATKKTPKKKAVSKYTKRNGTKVKAYTKNAW
jgi:hypothetical protein